MVRYLEVGLVSLATCMDLVRRWRDGQWIWNIPLLLLLSIVGICLDYRRLAEKLGFVRLASDDQSLGLVGVFSGATQLFFWLWEHKRSARACLGYMPFYFRGPLFIADNRCNNNSFYVNLYVILLFFSSHHGTIQVASCPLFRLLQTTRRRST